MPNPKSRENDGEHELQDGAAARREIAVILACGYLRLMQERTRAITACAAPGGGDSTAAINLKKAENLP